MKKVYIAPVICNQLLRLDRSIAKPIENNYMNTFSHVDQKIDKSSFYEGYSKEREDEEFTYGSIW